jgi:hypothetical protein
MLSLEKRFDRKSGEFYCSPTGTIPNDGIRIAHEQGAEILSTLSLGISSQGLKA